MASRGAVRAAARRRRAQRGAAISALSTVVVIGGIALVVLTSPGWPSVRATFFSWPDFARSFPNVLDGFWLDVRLFLIIEVVVLALGLLRHVILPQAVRRVVPPLLNDFVALQKDVALVSILGPLEAFRIAQIDASSNFNYTPLVAAALLYLCVTVPLARIVDRMQAPR